MHLLYIYGRLWNAAAAFAIRDKLDGSKTLLAVFERLTTTASATDALREPRTGPRWDTDALEPRTAEPAQHSPHPLSRSPPSSRHSLLGLTAANTRYGRRPSR